MRHRQGDIVLVVEPARQGCDCPAGNDLANENHATLDADSVPPPHVEAQVNFFEIGMKWKRNPQNLGIQETEPDQAKKGVAVPKVQLGSGGNKSLKQGGVHVVVQHRQLTPLCCEECLARINLLVGFSV